MKACTKGKHIDEGQLIVRKAGGDARSNTSRSRWSRCHRHQRQHRRFGRRGPADRERHAELPEVQVRRTRRRPRRARAGATPKFSWDIAANRRSLIVSAAIAATVDRSSPSWRDAHAVASADEPRVQTARMRRHERCDERCELAASRKDRLSPPLMHAFRSAHRGARRQEEDRSPRRGRRARHRRARASAGRAADHRTCSCAREVARDLEALMNTIALESTEDLQRVRARPQVDPEFRLSRHRAPLDRRSLGRRRQRRDRDRR